MASKVWEPQLDLTLSVGKRESSRWTSRSLLDKFRITDCKILSTPMEKGLKLSAKTDSKAVNELVYRQLVGSLIYLTTTSPYLSYIVSFISRFMRVTKIEHWTVAKRVLRYVKGTLDFGILYRKRKYLQLCGYINSDWAGSVNDRKSTFGCLQPWHGCSDMDQQEATSCSSPFIDKSNERSM
jgi:hypothetical protein